MRNLAGISRNLPLLLAAFVLIAAGFGAVRVLGHDVRERNARPSSSELMAAELARASERADVCSAANAVGVGLRGEYFSEVSLRGKAALVRIDSVINFIPSEEWSVGVGRPASVRWSGWIKPPLSGQYLFHSTSPNMRIFVARNLVAGGDSAADQRVDLAAGRFYPIEITVSEFGKSDTRISLEWTPPRGARYVIPKALLHLPTETVATPQMAISDQLDR